MVPIPKQKKRRMHKNQMGVIITSFFMVLLPYLSEARVISETDVRAAVQTWVRYVTADAKPDAVIEIMEPFRIQGQTLAYVAHISGGGFCLCGQDDLVLPVYIYSPKGKYDRENPNFRFFLSSIAEKTQLLGKAFEEKNDLFRAHEDTFLIREKLWKELIAGQSSVDKESAEAASGSAPSQMELAITTTWHQGAPYNNLCPTGDGGQSVVGCAATAMAQIMNYWNWPPSGSSNSSYTWDGDQSCGGNTSGRTLSASYSDPYDWQNMPDNCTNGCSPVEQDALSELSYEIGVSVEMDYGRCGSGTPLYNFVTGTNPLVNNFLYDSDATYNSDYEPPLTDADTIINEIQWLRPIEIGGCLASNGEAHYWVVHGYNKGPDPPEFLMNLGWGDPSVWSTWDAVANRCHNYIVQIAPQNVVRFVGNTNAGDGSPNNPHLNIEEAIQQSPIGSTLIFKAGSVNTFTANPLTIDKALTLKGKDITIKQYVPQ